MPNQIARLNRMHREICGIDDLMHVAEGIDLFFRYRHFWTVDKMRRAAPSAVSILGLIKDLQKVCQTNDWLFEDRVPFLAYKVDLLLRRHQYEVPLDSGTNDTDALQFKHRTLWSNSRNTTD